MIPRDKFLAHLKQVLLNAFEAFLHNSIFNKALSYLGEKQGTYMSEYDQCSSRYNRAGNFIVGLGEEKGNFV